MVPSGMLGMGRRPILCWQVSKLGVKGTWELIVKLCLLFHILEKVHPESSGKSQRLSLLLWGKLCEALLRVGKQTAAPGPSREEPQGPGSSPPSLSSVWEQSQENTHTHTHPKPPSSPGKLSLAGALQNLWLFPVLGWEEGGGAFVEGSHKASITLPFPGLHLPGPGSGGQSHGDQAGHLGRGKPCLPERGSHGGPSQPWSLDHQESSRRQPRAGAEAGAREVLKVGAEHADSR